MSIQAINEVLGKAVISDDFRAGLLNGRRAELLRAPEFQLEPEEAELLLAIQADDFQAFGAAVEAWVNEQTRLAARHNAGATRTTAPAWNTVKAAGVLMRQP